MCCVWLRHVVRFIYEFIKIHYWYTRVTKTVLSTVIALLQVNVELVIVSLVVRLFRFHCVLVLLY